MNANARLTGNIDHTIDRALSALRDAQPRSGLESRILTSLEHRASTPQTTRFLISAHVALWAATSAAILAVASLIILHYQTNQRAEFARAHQTHVPPTAIGLAPLRVPQAPTGSGIESLRTSTEPGTYLGRHPERSAMARSRRTPVFENCSDRHDQGCAIHDDKVAVNEVSQTPTDAQLLADLHAPSHPAPPLPLTPQEKLFLRMLQFGNATQLAELDPLIRAKHDADETTAFKTFFPDPPPLKQPLGDAE